MKKRFQRLLQAGKFMNDPRESGEYQQDSPGSPLFGSVRKQLPGSSTLWKVRRRPGRVAHE